MAVYLVFKTGESMIAEACFATKKEAENYCKAKTQASEQVYYRSDFWVKPTQRRAVDSHQG